MIYILTEQFMNGTVTMGITTTGIEADSFNEACKKLTTFQNWNKAENAIFSDSQVTYTIPGVFPTFGCMKNEALKIRWKWTR
jgi:hypothetical protein